MINEIEQQINFLFKEYYKLLMKDIEKQGYKDFLFGIIDKPPNPVSIAEEARDRLYDFVKNINLI